MNQAGAGGGGGASLAGLSPEQILGFMTRSNTAQEVGNRSFSELYDALQKQAYASYLGRRDTGGTTLDLINYKGHRIRRQDLPSMINALSGPGTHSVEAGEDGFYYTVSEDGTTKKTDIPVPSKNLTHAPKAGAKVTEATFGNTATGLDEVWTTNPDGSKRDYRRVKEMDPAKFVSSMKDMKDEKSKTKSMFWNRNVKGTETTGWAYAPDPWGPGAGADEKFPLPLYQGEQMTMSTVRELARNENKTVDQIVLEIYQKTQELKKK